MMPDLLFKGLFYVTYFLFLSLSAFMYVMLIDSRNESMYKSVSMQLNDLLWCHCDITWLYKDITVSKFLWSYATGSLFCGESKGAN